MYHKTVTLTPFMPGMNDKFDVIVLTRCRVAYISLTHLLMKASQLSAFNPVETFKHGHLFPISI